MKYIFQIIFVLSTFHVQFSIAQVTINTDSSPPDASAIMDVKSTNKGILIARMTSSQRNMISNAATGLLVFDTDTESFWFKNSTAWEEIGVSITANELADADGDTKIQVEEGDDDDNIIRFDMEGTEFFRMEEGRLSVVNNRGNVFMGDGAGNNYISGTTNVNVGLGTNALENITAGGANVAIGEGALQTLTSDNDNVAVGVGAGGSSTGSSNVYLGRNAGYFANGSSRLYIENTDDANPLIYGEFDNDIIRIHGDLEVTGNIAGTTTSGGTDNQQLSFNTGDNTLSIDNANTADLSSLGNTDDQQLSLNNTSNILSLEDGGTVDLSNLKNIQTIISDADGDTKIQVEEGDDDDDLIRFDANGTEIFRFGKNTNGDGQIHVATSNLFIGSQAGKVNTGANNIYIGNQAGDQNTSGAQNVAIGNGAGGSITTGNDNTFIGHRTGIGVLGTYSRNTFIGSQAGAAVSQNYTQNTFMGYEAGSGWTGSRNVLIGYQVGKTAFDINAQNLDDLLYIDNSDTVTPLIEGDFSDNTLLISGTTTLDGNGTGDSYYALIVDNANNPSSDRANGIRIAAGQNSNNSGSRFFACITPDGDEIGTVRQNGNSTVNFDTNSDIRLKTNIQPTRFGLAEVLQIEVKDYEFKSELGRVRTGFIAQQLYEHYPEAVSVGGADEKTDPWRVDYGKLTPILVKAIQEQHAAMEAQQAEVEQLKAQDSRITQLERQMAQLLNQQTASTTSTSEER